ncbi:winged helix-turn-helix domain-containing protein [Pseudoalteromonas sp. MMG012]|uniref:winged helix-turn-helix domain-containing protein n=1 Tax=Pseudoalteromonas sp. MMG012 TaxID=2822686 RepID=UPI001B39F3BB|nr:winged helix-turn-helix domain-containing protein [Pseudoalteromonas sp. MMG012]MBQ4852777.1 winged helix-turn-helix domain-containing protein [Pseudoalteromonas sp. MMG012]
MHTNIQFLTWVFFDNTDELLNLSTKEVIKLEPQVAQLLRLFIYSNGELLAREAISEHIWPNIIVEDNSLYQLLTKLRRLLNDNPKQPKVIKTIPKKGYQFIARTDVYTSQETPLISKKNKLLTQSQWWKWSTIPVVIVCSSAIAFYSKNTIKTPKPAYELSDLSYDLGLEYNVDAHKTKDLIAYIKNFNNLVFSNKQGVVLNTIKFPSRIHHPSWHNELDLITFWQYYQDQCILHVYKSSGQAIHRAKGQKCTRSRASSWLSSTQLTINLAHGAHFKPFHYDFNTGKALALPITLNAGDTFQHSIKAWQGKTYYLITSTDHSSKLITLDGTVHMQWAHPISLLSYDPKQQSIVTNNSDKHHTLIATTRDGHQHIIANAVQGMFTDLSIDLAGDIYTAVETWQVNIRDKDGLPIFSTTSIDYLPVSNPLGETAFMSKRSGVCEVYLHADDQIKQLSYNQGYDYVKHIEWQPKLNLLLTNRDKNVLLYDRQGKVSQFSPEQISTITQLGWHTNERVWIYDTHTLSTYTLTGQRLKEVALQVDALIYDNQNAQWLVFDNYTLYKVNSLANLSTHENWTLIHRFSQQQYNQLRNFKLRDNTLYWLSSWSAKDYIWQLPLEETSISLIKSDELIWHYDIAKDNSLNIAKMEAIEGDIKKLTRLVTPQ